MTVGEDDLFGKAALVQGMIETMASTDVVAADRRDALLSGWFDAAEVPKGEAEVGLDTLFDLADSLEANGVRPSRAGLEIFAWQHGLDAPGATPGPRFVAAALEARPGDLHLAVDAAPSADATAVLRMLKSEGDPAAFLAPWGLSLGEGRSLAPAHAEAIANIAKQRNIDLSAPDAAARLRPVGARPDGQGARFDWYTRVVESQGHAMKTGPNEMNVIGLRGFDVDAGAHDNAFGAWNDTIAFAWRDGDGQPHVVEYRATTDPGRTNASDAPDANGDGAGDVAHLRPGQYTYYVGTHRGRPGAGNPTVNVPVDRDTNHDGDISPAEREASQQRGDVGYGINIHWGPGYGSGEVGGYSLGCQVVTLDYGSFRAQIEPLLRVNERVPYTLVELDAVYAAERLA